MTSTKRWDALSPRTRRILIIGAVVEGAFKLAALRDLVRRPQAQVRGPKPAWGAALGLVGSAGLLPAAYFRFGRRPRASS